MARKTVLLFAIFMMAFYTFVSIAMSEEEKPSVRQPAVAGAFYPDMPDVLTATVRGYLRQVTILPEIKNPRVLIVPHAGYIYSGPVAAYGFKLIEGLKFDTVILIGSSHSSTYPGVSVYNRGSFMTPLGEVAVDQVMANEIIKGNDRFFFYEPAHRTEHSLEVELPFLQVVLKDFKIVPILMGTDDYLTCEQLAGAIQKATAGRNVLIVVSTDLSHYHDYDTAVAMDTKTVEEITKLDPKALYTFINNAKGEACGYAGVVSALILAKLECWDTAAVLKCANSGDTVGDKSRVVGYAAITIYKKEAGK
ncbi:MAG: AmmeMemoRadiSam system protein B [Candidatus Omnitrophica bacterium]|nr:AmmeMemoRadiSam system protein B [Candidatus Omnitrophota bacterium]